MFSAFNEHYADWCVASAQRANVARVGRYVHCRLALLQPADCVPKARHKDTKLVLHSVQHSATTFQRALAHLCQVVLISDVGRHQSQCYGSVDP